MPSFYDPLSGERREMNIPAARARPAADRRFGTADGWFCRGDDGKLEAWTTRTFVAPADHAMLQRDLPNERREPEFRTPDIEGTGELVFQEIDGTQRTVVYQEVPQFAVGDRVVTSIGEGTVTFARGPYVVVLPDNGAQHLQQTFHVSGVRRFSDRLSMPDVEGGEWTLCIRDGVMFKSKNGVERPIEAASWLDIEGSAIVASVDKKITDIDPGCGGIRVVNGAYTDEEMVAHINGAYAAIGVDIGTPYPRVTTQNLLSNDLARCQSITRQDLSAKFVALSHQSKPVAMDLLKRYGVRRVSELSAGMYQEVSAAIDLIKSQLDGFRNRMSDETATAVRAMQDQRMEQIGRAMNKALNDACGFGASVNVDYDTCLYRK